MKWANMLTNWAWISLFLTPLFTQPTTAQQALPLSPPQRAFIWISSPGMTDLGTLGGNSSYAFAVSDGGEVAGWPYLADNVTTHVFSWTAVGGMVDLGTLWGGRCSQGQFINSAGNVVATRSVPRVCKPRSIRRHAPPQWAWDCWNISFSPTCGYSSKYPAWL